MKGMRRSTMFQLPLLVSMLSFIPATAHGSALAGGPGLRHRAPIAGTALSPHVLRHVVARQVVGNPDIAELIAHRPVLGGAWIVASPNDVRFVAPGVVAMDYEDGHIAGRLVVRVVDAADPRTWIVLGDCPE